MATTVPPRAPRRLLDPARCAALAFLLVHLGALLAEPALAAHKGKWTPTHDMEGTAVHMALLPGDGGPYHSRIVWWQGAKTGRVGGEWGWKTGNESCDAWPAASFDTLGHFSSHRELFCSGNIVLDRRIVAAGGWEAESDAHNGIRRVRLFTPGSGSSAGTWAEVDSMKSWRYYPTSVVLRDGRVFTVSGDAAGRIRFYGGRSSGSPEWSDSLYMFLPTDKGHWVPSIAPTFPGLGSPPDTREGHTAVETPNAAQIYFGGRNDSGELLNDTHRLLRGTNQLNPEFEYRWATMPGLSSDPTIPEARREHAAIVSGNDRMVIFGGMGRNQADTADSLFEDVWKLHFVSPSWRWDPVEVLSSADQPAARFGHAMVYDTTFNRMLMVGGMDALSGNPSDTDVWAFNFTSTALDSGSWSKVDVACPACHPNARFDHTLTLDHTARTGPGGSGQSLLMFGGRMTTSACSDTLWRLWLYGDESVEWERVALGGSNPPSARAGHSATWDAVLQRLYIFGGETGSGGATDDSVYVTDLRETSPIWDRWAGRGQSLTGHTAMPDPAPIARLPEIYTPSGSGGSWEVQTTAPLWRYWYPPTFTVQGGLGAGGRVVTVDHDSYFLDLKAPAASPPAGPWRKFAGDLGFTRMTGVSYRPGRIMVAGGDSENVVTGKTRTLNATDTTSTWQASSNDMQPRFFHNLVLLPTGEVLVVGGTGTTPTNAMDGVWRPEIWDPDGGSGAGAWRGGSGADSLAENPILRNYHSTAILLPDGRVLVAGGNTDPDKELANLFCPPYLFDDSGDPLTRPEVSSTVTAATWGDEFTICGDTTGVTRVALVRAPATTHGFDQNQRYVPLGFVKKGSPERLVVHTPASPDSAPPGDYMLFVTGSEDGPDVPSIARWVHLRGEPRPDTCDVVAPIARKVSVDLVSSTSVGLIWTAPADDDSIAFSGRAKSSDVRRNASPITEANWSSSTQVSGETPPVAPGQEDWVEVSGLSACTVYYFGLKSDDDNSNVSAVGDTTSGRTACWGGGLSARRAPVGDASARRAGGSGIERGPGVLDATSRPVGGTIVAERRQVASDRWEVHLSRVSSVPGLDPEQGGIVVQSADGVGGWSTIGTFDPGEDNEIAIASLRGGSRVVFLGNWLLGSVSGAGVGEGGAVSLTDAEHSDEGDVTESVTGGEVELLTDETLTLTYETTEASGSESGWFLTMQRGGSGTASRRGPAAERVPTSFALHQNEPNPFGSTTMIRFDLPRAAQVKLEVFDLLGRRIATLADAEFAAGFHAVPWRKGAEIGPGIYMYRVIAGEFTAQRKMIVLP